MDIPGFFHCLPTQSLVLVVPTYTQDNCGHPRILPLPIQSLVLVVNSHSRQLCISQDSPPAHSIPGPSCPNLYTQDSCDSFFMADDGEALWKENQVNHIGLIMHYIHTIKQAKNKCI